MMHESYLNERSYVNKWDEGQVFSGGQAASCGEKKLLVLQ
jgi:hypothetical protein